MAKKARETEGGRKKSSILWFTLQMPTAARSEPGESRELASFGSPVRVAGTPVLGLSPQYLLSQEVH